MKLATFVHPEGHAAIGAVSVKDQTVLDFSLAYELVHGKRHPALSSMLELIQSGPVGMAVAQDLVSRWNQGQFGQLSPQWGELMLVVHSTQFIKELVAIGDCFGPRGL